MTNKFFKSVGFSFLLLISITLSAQDARYKFDKDNGEISVLADIDRKQLNKEDSVGNVISAPLRIAILFPLEVNLFEQGKWITLDDGTQVCKLVINAPLSHGIIVRYSDFYLPQGAKLYVYNPDNNLDSWAYGHNENPDGGRYSTEVLLGDRVVLEYVPPKNPTTEKPRLDIQEIGYKYKLLNESAYVLDKKAKRFNDPLNRCMVNVNCPEGIFWQNQKKGVVLLRYITKTATNTFITACSGSLVNNTDEDKTPYVLTAYHCFYEQDGTTVLAPEESEFIFEYETTGCENESIEPPYKLLVGADILVLNPMSGGSDAALLKLKKDIPSDWDVYYNGWSRENVGSNISGGAIIHHPLYDVKKISLYDMSPIPDQWCETPSYCSTPNAHWKIRYSLGVTEQGSSGSPMFDQNGYIIGTLSGGSSSCAYPNLEDWYGKFWYHFDQSPNPDQQLKKYLDPKGLDPVKLKGLSVNPTPPPQPDRQPALIASFDNSNLLINARGILKKVTIVSLSGVVVYSKLTGFDSSTHTVDTSNWKEGVYIISVDADKWVSKSLRIIKRAEAQAGQFN